jgi:hypothetical protein
MATNVHVASTFSSTYENIVMYLAYNDNYKNSKLIDIDDNKLYRIDNNKYQLLGETADTRPTIPY